MNTGIDDSDTKFIHLVGRAYQLPVTLVDCEVASWLWPRLRDAFPFACAATLMPNHLHVVTPTECAETSREQLARLLGNLARSTGLRSRIRFEPTPHANLQEDPVKVLRQTRYVVLNAARAGLVDDPLVWEWSTHRDVIGAIHDPWVPASRLAALTGRAEEGFAAWWHQYVTRDDTVHERASVFPFAAEQTRISYAPLDAVVRAAAAATRCAVADVRRRGNVRDLFLSLALRVGWDRSELLAEICDCDQRTVQRARQREPHPALPAALLCLGDPRLHARPASQRRAARHPQAESSVRLTTVEEVWRIVQ